MARLTQNDFRLEYVVSDRYPIIAQWVLDTPLSNMGKTYGADITQKRDTPDAPMLFYPIVRISTVDGMDPDNELDDAVITSNGKHLGEYVSMNDALVAIMRFVTDDARREIKMADTS